MRWYFLGFAALVGGCGDSSSGSADRACTQIGCVNGFNVTVTSAGTWKAGKYTVTTVADGVTTTCTADFPLPSQPNPQCSGPGVQVGLSGSALPADQQSIASVALSGAPKSVIITMSRDGVMFASQSFTPTYATSRPNGPSCEPVCTSSNASMAVIP